MPGPRLILSWVQILSWILRRPIEPLFFAATIAVLLWSLRL